MIRIFCRNCLFESVPGAFSFIIYIRIRTDFPCHIIMAYHMICRNVIFFHQIPDQLNSWLHRLIFEIPVPVRCSKCLCSPFSHAHFNPDTVGISAFRMFIATRPAMPGNVLIFHTLPDFTVKPDKIMCRWSAVPASVIDAVLFCSAQCTNVVNDDIFDSGTVPGCIVIFWNHTINFVHITHTIPFSLLYAAFL